LLLAFPLAGGAGEAREGGVGAILSQALQHYIISKGSSVRTKY
jgi:hypothetical protein